MNSLADGSVKIQTTSESTPSTPSVKKTITSPLPAHKIASSLSLMRTHIPFFSDAYPRPNIQLTHKSACKSCIEQTPKFAPRNEISCLIRARNCVNVAMKCVTTLFLSQELGML